MDRTTLLYLLPALPILLHGVFALRFRSHMQGRMGEKVAQREAHRSVIFVLAGFSFSGLLALTLVDAATRQNLAVSVYYLLISFLCYLFALNLQDYKKYWWQDRLGDALIDIATLSLILSVMAIIWASDHSYFYKAMMTAMAGVIWMLDHALRVYIFWEYLQTKEANDAKR